MTTKLENDDTMRCKQDSMEAGSVYCRHHLETGQALDYAVSTAYEFFQLVCSVQKELAFSIWDNYRKLWVDNAKQAMIENTGQPAYTEATDTKTWSIVLDKRWFRVRSELQSGYGLTFQINPTSQAKADAKAEAVEAFLPRLSAFRKQHPKKSLEECEAALVPVEQKGVVSRKDRRAVESVVAGAVDLVKKTAKADCQPYVAGGTAWLKTLTIMQHKKLQETYGYPLVYPEQ
jgi:hypothetical protein